MPNCLKALHSEKARGSESDVGLASQMWSIATSNSVLILALHPFQNCTSLPTWMAINGGGGKGGGGKGGW